MSRPSTTTRATIGVFRFGGAAGGAHPPLTGGSVAGGPENDGDWCGTDGCGGGPALHDGSDTACSPHGSAGSAYGSSSELPPRHGGPGYGPFCDIRGSSEDELLT